MDGIQWTVALLLAALLVVALLAALLVVALLAVRMYWSSNQSESFGVQGPMLTAKFAMLGGLFEVTNQIPANGVVTSDTMRKIFDDFLQWTRNQMELTVKGPNGESVTINRANLADVIRIPPGIVPDHISFSRKILRIHLHNGVMFVPTVWKNVGEFYVYNTSDVFMRDVTQIDFEVQGSTAKVPLPMPPPVYAPTVTPPVRAPPVRAPPVHVPTTTPSRPGRPPGASRSRR